MRDKSVMLALAFALGLFAAACSSTKTPDATATPRPVDTPFPSATATEAATTTTSLPRHLTLDTSQHPQPPEAARAIGEPPASAFPLWDGKATVIYDTQTGKTFDLGPGSQPASFSPDEMWGAWAAGTEFANGTEVFAINLATGERKPLGPGRTAQFIDNRSIVVFSVGGNDRTVVDVVTGERRPYAAEETVSQVPRVLQAPKGYSVEPANANGPTDVRTFTVRATSSGQAVLTFEAIAVVAAGKDELVAAAAPVDGNSNLYLVDIPAATATFVAAARPGRDNWPFSAAANGIVWTDDYCSLTPGPVKLFDLQTNKLVRFEPNGADRYARLTPGGLLAMGTFGASYLVDPSTLAYVAVIPSGGNVSWSLSYRYASHGPYGGHGGLCGGG